MGSQIFNEFYAEARITKGINMHGATLRSDHECPLQAYSPENITNIWK